MWDKVAEVDNGGPQEVVRPENAADRRFVDAGPGREEEWSPHGRGQPTAAWAREQDQVIAQSSQSPMSQQTFLRVTAVPNSQ